MKKRLLNKLSDLKLNRNLTPEILNQKLLVSHKTKKIISQLGIYILLIGISYVFLYPLLQMISMAFMSKQDLVNPEVDWIPTSFSFKNFGIAASVLDLGKSLFNSIWFSLLLAITQTFITALAGFALARYNFKFKKFWFVMILVSFILPVPVVIIPRIMMIESIGDTLGTTLFGSFIPQLMFNLGGQGINSAILILIFYSFFKMIPASLDEAARMDGATSVEVFWHIFIKMSIPIITTVFLFSFVWNWNESHQTGIFIGDGLQLLPQQLSTFDSNFGSRLPSTSTEAKINETYKMAATIIAILPLFIIYLFAQKQFIEGIENTGITGE
ncbi:carbohydrate ABC transporter permease [Haloplasma contractile]|uniref:Binding-protein-dependent transport systems inner membrane component n=1 Tax=Haloplasma contractile SSD-17B TaxID=1033810 RepID=U2E8Y0_9MOLU|nr:carbohydrate ABC transporter permease [Haloplasma contractile]ERJ11598.1 Binding-protein-dependent transport systems inner membrane component [Haloplasma contractile SSD-17B]